ncbi:MAG: ABC transporter ATP-binding protein [Eggerthellaceae bacterium]|nr:ABC transporter ATP-binding protein [Eggerthellaceae bacterium]
MAHSHETAQQPNAFGKLYHFMKADRGKMAVSVALACLGEVAGMVPYLAIAWLAAGLLENTLTLEGAALAALAAAVAHTVRFFCTWRSSMMSHRIAFRALQNMRDAMAEKMSRVPMGTIVDTSTGTFKNRFIDNVNQLEDAIAHFMPELPSNVFGPMLAMVVVFVIDWRMGLAGLATLPLGVLFYAGMMRDYKVKMERYITSEQKMNSSLVEYVNGIQVIKAYQRTASSYGAFADAVADYHDSTLAWYRQSWVWMAAIRSVMPCTLLAGLPLGVLFMADGSLSLPAFLACITIPLGFIGPVMKFSVAASQISRMDICLTVIWDFLNEPELTRPAERANLEGQSFEFDQVSFAYHEGAEVLHGVSFTTQPGTTTAIVGPSGSGKSTIAKLMAGFWDATDGQVRFGGVDVRDIPFEQLMENISYVSQDTFLFDKTLAENIRLGRPEATDEQVRSAARAAGCEEFIQALPLGFETPAGEAGARLSGGEKQRIAIARAVLKNAPIVILDEATAYADPENEAYVQRALDELVRDKTLVTIAHRLSTVKGADCILVVDAGRIVGKGTHAELLESCPLYARMWSEHVAATTGRHANAVKEAM